MGLCLRDNISAHSLSPNLSLSRCDGIVFVTKGLRGAVQASDSFAATMSRCEQGLEESPRRRSEIRGGVAVRSVCRVIPCPSQQLVHNANSADM